MNDTALAIPPSSALAPMNIKDLMAQVALVQEVMRSVMQDGQHYGKVPGCGDKPSLLKPGAEKLCFVFRLAPTFEVEERNLEHGHREYRVRCKLHTIGTGNFVGEGQGVCSTMEAKYRFRTGPKKPTGHEVPKGFWDLRRENPVKAQEMIGGKGFAVAKNEAGIWEIVEQGEKVEHDNPADYYNTVLKMAQKRAHVAVTLTATAASDIFTQDLEDIQANMRAYDVIDAATTVASEKPAPAAASPAPERERAAEPAARPAGEPAEPKNGTGDWRQFRVPKFIKKYADRTLGDMEEKDLAWWGQNYQPKGFGGRPPGAGDIALRKALDAALDEMRQHAGETAQRVTEVLDREPAHAGAAAKAPKAENLGEDVPF